MLIFSKQGKSIFSLRLSSTLKSWKIVGLTLNFWNQHKIYINLQLNQAFAVSANYVLTATMSLNVYQRLHRCNKTGHWSTVQSTCKGPRTDDRIMNESEQSAVPNPSFTTHNLETRCIKYLHSMGAYGDCTRPRILKIQLPNRLL